MPICGKYFAIIEFISTFAKIVIIIYAQALYHSRL